jgi:two-component system OmpR family sensor kinase
MTVKTRITLFVAGAGFIASLLFSMVVFLELVEEPIELLDTVLKEEAYGIIGMLVNGQKDSKSTSFSSVMPAVYSYWIRIYDQQTKRMIYQSNLAQSVALPQVATGGSTFAKVTVPPGLIEMEEPSSAETTFRIRTFAIVQEGRTYKVQIARPMENLQEDIWELFFVIVSGLIFSTLALVAISHFVAGKILHPIGAMKDLAQDISEKNLHQRIPVGQGQDEFSELAKTINRMLDRLQYSFARQRDFLFDTSHELKTPLTTIRLAVDEISAYDSENLPSFAKENFLQLKNQVLRMEKLVKDLLSLSSLETLTRIDPKPVHLSTLLSDLVAEYQLLADARNILMIGRLGDKLLVQGDGEKLRRAFSNIIDNAIKYNVDGGRVEVIGDESANGFTIAVTNTGPGVAEADVEKVFEQFYRVERSRSMQHGGFGLGLAIVKRIVELHGGKVKLESKPDVLTRVTIHLPRLH